MCPDERVERSVQRTICSIFCIHKGCRCVPLSGRHLRRARLRKLVIGIAAALATARAIWFAGQSEKDPTRLFVTAIPTVSGLLGLLWAMVLLVRGEKLDNAPLPHVTVGLRDHFSPGARWMILPAPETRLSAPPAEPPLGAVATCCWAIGPDPFADCC